MPSDGQAVINPVSVLMVVPLIYASEEAALIPMKSDSQSFPITAKSQKELEKEKAVKEQNERKLKEVEQQQADFGEKK